MICGWFYPTTLTATRGLFSVGTVHRIEIDATTSELAIFIQRVTTPTKFTTTGLGLAINQWTFIACLQSWANAAVDPAIRVWRSFGSDVPQLVSTAIPTGGNGSGNMSTGAAVTIGNVASTGTVAFQGDIGRFDYVLSTVSASLTRNASGTISADEELQIWYQYVVPLWSGSHPTLLGSGTNANNGITHVSVDLDDVPAYGRRIRNGGSITTMGQAMTVSGATVSANRAPMKSMRCPEWPDLVRI